MARATTTTRTDPSALPSRIGKLLGEVRWFLLLAVTLALGVILVWNFLFPTKQEPKEGAGGQAGGQPVGQWQVQAHGSSIGAARPGICREIPREFGGYSPVAQSPALDSAAYRRHEDDG